MAGYDPKKAAEYNRLIQQGVKPEDAIVQAGITYEEEGNYTINEVGTPATNRDYGKMTAMTVGQGKVAGIDYDRTPADPPPSQSQITRVSYTETSTETVSGGGSTTITAGPRIPTAQSQQYADAGVAKQAEIDQFIKDNPSNFARKKQGLPPLTPEEAAARDAQLATLQDQRSQLYNQQIDAESTTPGTTTFVPNTTTTTRTTTYQSSSSRAPVNFDQDQQLEQATELQLDTTTGPVKQTSARDSAVNPASDPSQFPAYDDEGNLQPGFAINDETGQTYYRGFEQPTSNTSVNPAVDPSQFPAYDDEGNLMPGFAINDETGQSYYRGFPSQDTTNTPVGEAGWYDYGSDYSNPPEYPSYADADIPLPIDSPYYGLSPDQIQQLGGADPTDPYIRARLGIPQLPGSTLFATGGFGTIKTGVPAIDSALGIIGKVTSLFSNFASTVGGLFGPKPTASAAAATTGSGVAGLAAAPATPATTQGSVNPASDPSQFPAYDDEGNLMPGFAINDETGQPYYTGMGPATTQGSVNPASDPSQFPAYDDEGNLMPGFAINDENGQPYYRGFDVTKDTAVNPASDPSQFPAYDDEGNLMPGFAINDENGQPYYAGVGPGATNMSVAGLTDYGTTYDEFGSVVPKGPPTGTDATTLSADQADAFYNGTGTPTAAQQAATDAQTAADAAALYPGTNNTNLRNINEASAAIAQNEAGIARAEEIIAQNNAELADPNISDERRAELEANNAAQENYIRLAESNTAENELVIEANADAFAAGGGEPDSGQAPLEVAALEDPGLEPPVEEVISPTEADVPVDPLTDEELAVQEAYQQENREILAEQATDVEPGEDPFEQARLEAAAAADAEGPTEADLNVDPLTDEELAVQEAYQQDNRDILAEQATDVEPGEDPFEQARLDAEARANEEGPTEADLNVDTGEDEGLQPPPGAEPDGEPTPEPYALNPDEDEAIAQQEGGGDEQPESLGDEESFQGAQEAAVREQAKQQATFQARYKQQGNQDWRVRLSLGPNAQYLYRASPPGILAPLAATDGVIFPYTPSITTTYSANYEQYDLIHSNYRGLYYKNSRVGDIQIRGTFTAQDTTEANYLLAVIHFFRSATKMFYGQDAQRGTPPPVCLLNGLGMYQFSDHPVVISSFNYTTPNDVDYIRATNPNNYGSNLLNRRAAVASSPGGTALAGATRLVNALLPKGAQPQTPNQGAVTGSVTNTTGATYVPTKMEIDITLIPVQTRSQVSKQFSLKGFANGDLLKGGFW